MERALTAAELDHFRTRPARTTWYLAVHQPASVFSTKITETPDTYPASALNTGAGFNVGNSALASKNMTIWIGALGGASDEGKIRLRGDIDSNVIQIAESGSGLNRYYSGKFITVMRQFDIWPKLPRYVSSASQWRMDYNESYSDELENYGPVLVMGPPAAGFLDGGTFTASFVGGSTQFVSATLSTANWTFPDGQTEARIGTEASIVAKTFTGASRGGSYFSLGVTDSAGASQIGRRLIYLFNDRSEPAQVEFTEISGGLRKGGYKANVRAHAGGTVKEFPDGAEILIFEETCYAGNATSIGGNYPFRNNVVFRGWIVDDSVNLNPFSGDVTFQAITTDGVMAKTHSKDIFHAYAVPPTGTSEWIEAEYLNPDRVAIDLIKHRSTVAEITDFHLSSGTPMAGKIAFQDLPKSSLWKQLTLNYGEKGPRGIVASDMQGNIYATEDVLIDGLSANRVSMMHIEKQDKRDTVAIGHPHFDKNALVELYSVASTNYVGARSPGADAHGYFGGTKVHQRGLTVEEVAATAQDIMTTWAGNLRAKLNNPLPKVVVPLSGNLKMDSVPQARVTMSLSPTENVRGYDWNNKEFLPYGTKIQYDSLAGTALETTEMEAIVDGKGGSAITFERIVPMAPQPVDNPPPPGFGAGNLFAFNNVIGARRYTTGWAAINDTLTGTDIQDRAGGKNSAILYKCDLGAIYKSENSGASWVDITPGSDPDGSAASAVDYIDYAADPSDTAKNYFLARNLIGSDWKSWLLYFNSGTSTYTWGSLGGTAGTGASADYNIPYYGASNAFVDYSVFTYLPSNYSTGGGGGNAQSLQAYSAGQDHFIFTYQEGFLLGSIAGQITGASIAMGASLALQDTDHETERWQVATLGDSDAVAVYTDTASNWSIRRLQSRVLTRSGQTLSLGIGEGLLSTGGSTDLYHDMHVIELDGGTALVAYGDRASGLYRTLTNNSGSIIVGTAFDFTAGSNENSWFTGGTRLAKLDTSKDWAAVISSSIMQYSDPHEPIQAWLLNLQGASATNHGPFTFPGSPNFTWSQSIDVVDAGTNRFVAVYEENSSSGLESVVGRRSGSTIDFSEASAITLGGGSDIDLFPIDSTHVGLAFTLDGVNDGLQIVVGTLAGGSIDWSPASGFDAANNAVQYMLNAEMYDTNKFIGGFEGEDNQLVLVSGSLTTTGGGAGNAKGISTAVGGLGGNVYTTYSDDTNFKLSVNTGTTLGSTVDTSMGEGTFADVDAKQLIAHPQTIPSDDNFCYVFGRMINPGGLTASPIHIIKTEDAGATFTAIESGWGTDICGGMGRQSAAAYAVRNVFDSYGAFYTIASGNNLMSTFPFTVDPGGMIATTDGYVIVGSSKPKPGAIRYSVPPFIRFWKLLDYPASGTVTGLAV